MKKTLSVILMLLIAFSLFGCDGRKDQKAEKGKTSVTENDDNKKKDKKKDDKIPQEFSINHFYLDLLGEDKEDIDEILGIGKYSYEFAMTDYKNGIMIGWNSQGEEPREDDEAVSIYITLENLFHNCPQSLTVEDISALFSDSYVEYSPMDDENVLCVNYKGMSLSFYPDSGLRPDSYAFMNTATPYALPSGEYYEGELSDEEEKSDASFYEYALSHDSEFWSVNKDWRDDREYYFLADVDQDSRDELIVKIGCGIAIFKKTGSGIEEVFRNTLPDSSGSVHYWVANYDGVDYIAYNSASSSGYTVLYKLSGKELAEARVSQTIDGEYFIDDEKVFESQYEKYLDSIKYYEGMGIEELK